MHHHGGAVADKNSVNCTFRKQAGERVVVTRNHRELAAFGFCAEKISAAHDSPRCLKRRAERGRSGRGETSLSIALVPVKN